MASQHDTRQDPNLSVMRPYYSYSPLNEAAHEIRLLTILPNTFASEVQLELKTHIFETHSSEPLQYEALSYAWGTPADPIEVNVEQGTLSVTQNLAEALRYLRYEDKPRVMWIDAICVNQKDVGERSSQVKRMANIFSAASQVVIWLGKESIDSTMAMECCQFIASNVTVDWIRQEIDSVDEHWTDYAAPLPFDMSQLLAISRLLNRDWFKRLWIWQEVSLASNAIVLCGTKTLSWAAIRDAVFCVYAKSLVQHFNISWSHRQLLRNLCKGPRGLSLDKLVENTKYSLCSDPRDRIFALFSLLSAYDRRLTREPDYSTPAPLIYESFTRHYIQGRNHLKLLSAVESRDEYSELPSWVPDWSSPRLTTPFTRTKYSGLSPASANFRADKCLEVHGVTVGTIKMTEPFRRSDPDSRIITSDICSELYRICLILDGFNLINGDDRNLDRLCRILCPNTVLDVTPSSISEIKTCLKTALKYLSEDINAVPYMKKFLNAVLVNCYKRSLFRCENGMIGLGPRFASEGDKVVVLLGCDTAMILRPSKSTHQYRLIGEAVYDGAMDGSVFLGPLPEGYQLALMEVEQYNEGYSARGWRFIRKDTGIVTAEDPRLAHVKLPVGWSRSTLTRGEFVNEGTGETSMYDPRFTVERLQKRGIMTETFEII